MRKIIILIIIGFTLLKAIDYWLDIREFRKMQNGSQGRKTISQIESMKW